MLLLYKSYGCSCALPAKLAGKIDYGYACLQKLYAHLGCESNAALKVHLHSTYKPVKTPSKTLLAQKGELMENVYFLVSGTVSIYNEENGKKQVLNLLTPGNLIMSSATILNNQPSNIWIQTEEPCIALQAYSSVIQGFINSTSSIDYFSVLQNLISKLLFYQREIASILQLPSQKRVAVIKQLFPEMIEHFSQKNIASMFGITSETYSRTKHTTIINA